jgi:pectate lyase
VGSFASVLIENNYFQDVNDPHRFADSNPAFITATGNIYDDASGRLDEGQGTSSGQGGQGGAANDITPFTDPPYAYTLDETTDVPDIVTRCAGPQ